MPRTSSPAALILGAAGLIPFLGLSALVILGHSLVGLAPRPLLAAYGAVIASFLGGLRWGAAAASPEGGGRRLRRRGVPSLVAWAACSRRRPGTSGRSAPWSSPGASSTRTCRGAGWCRPGSGGCGWCCRAWPAGVLAAGVWAVA